VSWVLYEVGIACVSGQKKLGEARDFSGEQYGRRYITGIPGPVHGSAMHTTTSPVWYTVIMNIQVYNVYTPHVVLPRGFKSLSFNILDYMYYRTLYRKKLSCIICQGRLHVM
jgi:hypothetical protein